MFVDNEFVDKYLSRTKMLMKVNGIEYINQISHDIYFFNDVRHCSYATGRALI
jgi:hypothetical protein